MVVDDVRHAIRQVAWWVEARAGAEVGGRKGTLKRVSTSKMSSSPVSLACQVSLRGSFPNQCDCHTLSTHYFHGTFFDWTSAHLF